MVLFISASETLDVAITSLSFWSDSASTDGLHTCKFGNIVYAIC